MTSFQYMCTTQIDFGVGAVERLPEKLQAAGFGRRLMVVTDPGLIEAGIVEKVVQPLHRHGYTVTLFDQVQPNPRDADCLAGAQLLQSRWCDAVVAVGGGSAMDTAKTIALLARHGGTPQAYADGKRAYGGLAPVACVPTTAGTGSEVTRSAVITEQSTHRKMTLKHEWLRPTLAILDPALTITVPRPITAATGVDALVHAIEGYTCRRTQPISQAFGAQAMGLIVRALPKAYRDPLDLEARSDMLLGSLLAGLCFGSADVAAVHCLAEALGGLYDTPHGLANAVFLLPVLKYNAQEHVALHANVARMTGMASDGDEPTTAVEKLLTGIEAWLQELEIPALSSLPRVSREDSEKIVELALANNSTESNVRTIDANAYRTILDETFRQVGL
ncbi:iron-containing alcohol dehydrogenase [Alicyclobacillus fastidiosus]|uniref:Iron-containing alcohol dehydrogenase n=1 Tax=Alicyclobacillus fastidiosus TaxID=392011 RepID=A0ABY6ZFA5_9BACL|nr:iron-containing alcohol dehydrogenase [Alicyclobacillus fastidiosus]WAH41529.1 iron-containing alcohol dehydrogenase [Alicyclobacillus fastidiosus]GMA63183.1 alcohol dehydrogenase [Alicyclobacillus fastidiosus]